MADGGASAPASPDLAPAIAALHAGAVIGVPTDTVYGLAVDPTVPGATDALFALKGRPTSVELPVLVADRAQADTLVGPDGLDGDALVLAERFWPGGLTLVLPRRAGVDWALGGRGDSIGVRCPAHPSMRRLCRAVGPLATTSANRHGRPSLTRAGELEAEFGAGLAAVVDGGPCGGLPSTVADLTGDDPRCLRAGAVPWDEVLAALGHR